MIKIYLNKVQSNINTCQEEIISVLDRILAFNATIRLVDDITSISLSSTSIGDMLNQIELCYHYYKMKLEFFELYQLKIA